jgi:hypothetical protein
MHRVGHVPHSASGLVPAVRDVRGETDRMTDRLGA